MNFDSVPTIESLMEQNAISFTGKPDWIAKCKSLINPIADFDVSYEPISMDHLQGLPLYEAIIVDTNNVQLAVKTKRLMQDEAKGTTDMHPLYTADLNDDFTVTAHIKGTHGYTDKIIYHKVSVNPKRLTHSLNALIRAIDRSSVFFTCYECNTLAHSALRSQNTSLNCTGKECHKLTSQHFDVSAAKFPHMYNGLVRIDKLKNMIALSTFSAVWLGAHEPTFNWVVEQSLPLSATPRQVKTAAKELYDSRNKLGKCIHCNELMNELTGENDTCYACASKMYGIRF